MATKTAAAGRKHFYDSMAVLDQTIQYANADRNEPPATLSGLTEPGQALLGTDQGREVVRTWKRVFGETIALLNRFREEDLSARSEFSDEAFDQVLEAANRSTEALVRRLNKLGAG